MKKIKIAILGSCATRDIFNSRFNPNYKEFYEVILLQNQTSIISLMSSPLSYQEEKLDNLNSHELLEVKSDLDKDFLEKLKELKPEYLIIDLFADNHFGVLQLENNCYITNNRWKISKTTYYKELHNAKILQLSKNAEEYFSIWKKSVDKLFEFLQSEVPNTKVIIHKVRNVDSYIDENNIVQKMSNTIINVPYFNQLWERLDKYVIDTYKTENIYLFDKEYHSFIGHPWGKFHVHYTMDYYSFFLIKLHLVVIGDLQKTLKKSNKAKIRLEKLVKHYESETIVRFIKRQLLKFAIIRKVKDYMAKYK